MSIFTFDKSPRTTIITKPWWIMVAATVLIVISMIMSFAGLRKYDSVMSHSSTPVGSSIKFSQSGAELKLSGLYTDQDENVILARLTPNDNANEMLPYKGSDYSVFVKSESTEGLTELPILFGKMSTDGDMFLIIPKPSDKVYSFAIVNPAGEVAPPATTGASKVQSIEDQEKSMARALSDFDQSSKQGENGGVMGNDGDKKTPGTSVYDTAGFRMTMNPSAEGDEYRPEKIDANLYDEQTKQFDFETFFKLVYVDAAVRSLTDKYNEMQVQIDQYRDQAQAMSERLDMNPNDTTALKSIDKFNEAADANEKEQATVVDELTRFQSLEYDPSIFQNFQTTATVVE